MTAEPRCRKTRTLPLLGGGNLARTTGLARTPFVYKPRNTGPRQSVTDKLKDRARAIAGEMPDGTPYCEVCTVHPARQKQHRTGRGMGGSRKNPAINNLSNLILVCGDFGSWTGCHDLMEHRDRTAAERDGWIVKRGTDPSTVPCRLGDSWYLLDDEGGAVETGPPEQPTEGNAA